MVIRTPPLRSLRTGFLPQIHHPLPLNKRESQKLLDSITSSFRKNLDREHPWQTDETLANTPPNSKSTDSVEPPLATATATTTNHRPTDRHLRAILCNPLFSHPRTVDASTSLRTGSSNKPFDVFDSAVSKGLMTPRRAAGFLAALRSQLMAESPDEIRQRMGMSGGGLRVVRWLRSSGLENDLGFLSDLALIRQIIPFLYAEGLQEIAWTWLAQLAARAAELEFEKTPGKANAQSLFQLLSAVINESIKSGSQSSVSLDESFAALVKANGMLPHDNPAANAAVKSAWAKLSWTSTVDALERPKPSVTLFENFVDIGRPLNLPLDLAHLDLHHPTTPTHSTAVEYLRTRRRIVEKVSDMSPRAQQRVLCFVLDAAERLKRTGQIDDAPWVERIKNAIFERLNLAFLNIQNEYSLNSSLPLREGP